MQNLRISDKSIPPKLPARYTSRFPTINDADVAEITAVATDRQIDADDTKNWRSSPLKAANSRRVKRQLSVSMRWSMASEPDVEVDDELSRVQQKLRDLKKSISTQSKKNFLLERDVRYLDSRIALLIQNRMSMDEYMTNSALSDDSIAGSGDSNALSDLEAFPDDRKKQLYSNMFFLLQTEPRLVAHLTRLLTLAEIDTLLQTVMFTIYGNQYDSREEHLLLTMFQSVLADQFEAATDFGSLLRANTPASRMMTTYTRRGPGQQYLKFVLSDNINTLVADYHANLEINPVKVYEQMINQLESDTGKSSLLPRTVSQEDAEANDDVTSIRQPRLDALIHLANLFLETIISQLEQVPYGIRWICKQIKLLTKAKYPEASEWSVCSLIGGFFFLRFINPAIVTPQSYMIVEKQPSQNPRRTLTLIAKMLQNLANKPAHNKETYMTALALFSEANKDRVAEFLNKLCDVDDFYESLEMDQFMCLSVKSLAINVSLNEMYHTHGFLLRHIDEICPQHSSNTGKLSSEVSTPAHSYSVSCNQLRVLLTDLSTAPTQLPRKNNKTILLPLYSRWENVPILFPHMVQALSSRETMRGRLASDTKYATGEPNESERLYLDTKSLFLQLIRKQAVANSLTPVSTFVPNVNETLTKAEKQFKNASMSVNALRIRQNLRILQDRYRHDLVSVSDSYKQFAEDVFTDLEYLASLRVRLKLEITPLETVYATICDHNNYLRSQLESYKAYLQNVRIQAAGGSRAIKKSVATSSMTTKGEISGAVIVKKDKSSKNNSKQAAVKLSHSQLEKDEVIVESGVPENRRANIFFNIQSPTPGSFVIGLHYKGRDKPIVEVDLKLDDLLQKQYDGIQTLDLEYVQLNVNKTLHMLNKHFVKR